MQKAWFRDAECTPDVAAGDACAAVAACVDFLRTAAPAAVLKGAAAGFQRARQVWRRRYVDWKMPCGNGLNVPDLLWLAQCHMAVCAVARNGGSTGVSAAEADAVLRECVATLRGWDSPTRHTQLAAGLNTLEQRAMWAVVFWGGRDDHLTPALLSVDLSQHDVSALSIGLDVHAALDNRAHTSEWKADQTAAAAAQQPVNTAPEGASLSALSPVLLVTLSSRVSFFCRLQLAVVRPRAGECVVHRGYAAHVNARRRLQLHTAGLARQHLRSLAAPGALEHHLRLLRTEWERVGGGTVVRSDVARRIEDLAASHKVSQLLVEDLLAADAVRHVELGAGEHTGPVERGEVLQLLRDVWTLVLLHNELDSLYYVPFLEHYVVLQQDLRERAAVYTAATRELRPRLPVLLRCCAAWCVHCPAEVWVCATLEEALVLWAKLVLERHAGRTEADVDIASTLRELSAESHVQQ